MATIPTSSENILYYSTNTYLAYWLSETFYNSKHFVWCSPVFDPEILNDYDNRKNIPPSSSPYKIYVAFFEDVARIDSHSSKIRENKSGLKKGAIIQRSLNLIDDADLVKITKIIDTAPMNYFRPLIYLIPKPAVQHKVIEVEVEISANPLSVEYQIIDLKSNEFEIIEFKKI
jgi:hypothetical protein